MIRTAFGRALLQKSGRTPLVAQHSYRLIVQHSTYQYFPGRSLVAARFIVSSTTNILKQNGLLRHYLRRRCQGPSSSSSFSTSPSSGDPKVPAQGASLFSRFKTMWKDYWYVMVPVHVTTSVCWFGAFYKVSTSGVDVGYYLRKLGISENVVRHVAESGMGHIAVAWALYKVATPIRYAVTLGGTTVAINVLRNMGYIKPAKELMAKGRDKIQLLKDKQLPKDK